MVRNEVANPQRSWRRVDGVDFLRGLSILFVLLNHVNMQLLFDHVPYTRGWPKQLVYTLVWNGQMGVQIFFAVSGFLITATALRRWQSLSNLGVADFYKLRFARIAPLLLALLALLSTLHLAHVEHFVVQSKTGGLARALLAALTFHVNVLEATRGYLPAPWDILWSLSVEEVFYLLFPWAGRFLRRGWLLCILLALLIVLGPVQRAIAANEVWKEYSYLGGMDAIAMGCGTALLLSKWRMSRGALRWAAISGTVLLVFSLGFSLQAYAWGLGRNGLGMTVLALGACLLIAASAESGWRAPRLLTPVLWLGRRSYEIYLTHVFIVLVMMALFVRWGKPVSGVPALFLATIMFSGLLGEVVARYFSEPMNRWLREAGNDGAEHLGSVVEAAESTQN